MGRLASSLKATQLRAANWKALARSCSVLCHLFPALLKVLARRCLLSFLLSFVIRETVEHNAAAIPGARSALLAAQPERLLNGKLHHSKGFNASPPSSCSQRRSPAVLSRHDNTVEKQSIGSSPGGVIDPPVQPQGPSALPGSRGAMWA